MSNNSEQGWYTLFFALFVLPLLFLFGSISLDVSEYFLQKDRVQHVLDEALILAQKHLPDRVAAEEVLRAHVGLHAGSAVRLEVAFPGSGIVVRAAADKTFLLGTLFAKDGVNVAVNVESAVQNIPQDVLLFVDTSASLSPALSEAPWGNEDDWPAAHFFSHVHQRNADPRLLTQQCFNPVFSTIKLAAVELYAYFKQFNTFQLGLGVYPGSVSATSLAREPVFPGERIDNNAVFVRRDESGFPAWSSTLCAAAAEQERSALHYRFQRESKEATRPLQRVLAPSWVFNSEYESYLLPEEYIWMLPAHDFREADFPQVLREARTYISGSPLRSERGSMATRAKRVGVFISANLPKRPGSTFSAIKDELAEVLSLYRQDVLRYGLNISLFYVLYRSPLRPVTDEDVSALRTFFNHHMQENGESLNGFKLVLLVASTPMEMTDSLLGLMSMEGRSSLIRR